MVDTGLDLSRKQAGHQKFLVAPPHHRRLCSSSHVAVLGLNPSEDGSPDGRRYGIGPVQYV